MGTLFAESASTTGNPIIIGVSGFAGSIFGGILGENTVKGLINGAFSPIKKRDSEVNQHYFQD